MFTIILGRKIIRITSALTVQVLKYRYYIKVRDKQLFVIITTHIACRGSVYTTFEEKGEGGRPATLRIAKVQYYYDFTKK